MEIRMTAKQCIKYNNFNEAFNRWKSAKNRWKAHWFETCMTIFNNSTKWAKLFIIDPIAQTIQKVKAKVRKNQNANIVWNCEQIKYPKNTELFYLVKGVGKDGNVIFSKVGTTTRTIQQRMAEELAEYHALGVEKMVVDKVYDCGEIPAECYESWFRAKYILKYPNTFKKNDRFFGVVFDLEEADRIFYSVGA